jgi:outer membrane receptor protein involved in Fe transport
VPLTTNVLKGEDLERSGQQSLRDLAGLLPGVNFAQTGGGGGGSEISMRGVTTGAQVGASVSMYIDDVPFGSSSAFAGGASNALDLGIFDLQRVEVLRGPQGTLYGAGAMGGLVKYLTIDPDTYGLSGQVGAEVSSTHGGKLSHSVRGSINVPLSENAAALRATVYERRSAGYVRDPGRGVDPTDDNDSRGGRLSLLLTPSRALSARFTALTQRSHRDGTPTIERDLDTGAPTYGRQERGLFLDEPFDVRTDLVSASIDWDLSWARLQSITAWQRQRSDGRYDVSPLYVPYLESAGLVNAGYALDYGFGLRKTTQELRLTSAATRQFEWLAGLYYSAENGDRFQDLVPFDAQRQPVDLELLRSRYPSTYRELAAYGTATQYFGKDADVTLGVRHSRNRQTARQIMSGLLAFDAPDADADQSVTTWMATGRYRLTPQQSLYLRAASGFRPGGPLPVFVNPVTGQPLTSGTFKSDSLWSYEAGWKADLLDGRVSMETALYQIDWKDIQVFTAEAGFSTIGNAGKARSRGLEWSLRAQATRALTLAASISVIDAELLEDNPALGALAGDRMPDTARFSAGLQADYRFAAWGRPTSIGLGLRHTGKRFNTFSSNPQQPSYTLPGFTALDLRAGMQFGAVQVGLYVRNLTNTDGQLSADTTLSALGSPARVAILQPRTIGLQLSSEF